MSRIKRIGLTGVLLVLSTHAGWAQCAPVAQRYVPQAQILPSVERFTPIVPVLSHQEFRPTVPTVTTQRYIPQPVYAQIAVREQPVVGRVYAPRYVSPADRAPVAQSYVTQPQIVQEAQRIYPCNCGF